MSYVWTPEDYQTLVALSAQAGIDPSEPAKLFFEETGGSMSPAQPGPPGSNVGGLNQMLAGNVPGVSMAQWLSMSAAQQMSYIFAWWQHQLGSAPFPSDAGTLLALNFLPGQFQNVHAATNPNAVLAGSSGPYASYYADNISLDPSRTGVITPATCELRLTQVAAGSAKWAAFAAQLAQYAGGGAAVATSSGSTWLYAILGGLAIGGAAYLAHENLPAIERAVRRPARRGRRVAYA